MMINWLWRLQTVIMVILSDAQKHLQDEGLNVDYRVWIPRELRIIPANVSLLIFHFQRQQIGFV